MLDTTGLQVKRSRRSLDRGAGEADESQYDAATEVFGVSAAAALYRREALEDVRLGNEFFDDDFFAYKEDVDLAWRLQRRGWSSRYVPNAVAYHHRGVQGDTRSDARIAFQRRHHSRFVNGYSYSNHLAMLVKNESALTMFLDFPWIFWYELKKFMFILLFEQSTLRSIGRFFHMLPSMLKKQRMLRRQAKVSSRTLRHWFLNTHG
jgi:GT2 family glycosyltransferase